MEQTKDAEKLQILKLFLAAQEMARPFAAPPGIPADRKAALVAAFDATMKDPEFLADAKKLDIDVNPVSAPRAASSTKLLAGAHTSHAEGRALGMRPAQGDGTNIRRHRHDDASLIGSRITRLEDEPLLRGQGRFVDDIALPGVLHAAFVRSPHPHALIRGVDKSAALALPGVHAVLTLDDLAPVMAQRRMVRHSNSGMPLDKAWPFALADGEVSYVGEPVAMVVADNRYIAEDAAALVRSTTSPCRLSPTCGGGGSGAPMRRELTPMSSPPTRSSSATSRGLRQGRACVQARSCGSTAAPRIRSRRAASSPRSARPTAASPCTPRRRRRTTCNRP